MRSRVSMALIDQEEMRVAGEQQRGVRDGTGPHKDSLRRKKGLSGRKKGRGAKCPCER